MAYTSLVSSPEMITHFNASQKPQLCKESQTWGISTPLYVQSLTPPNGRRSSGTRSSHHALPTPSGVVQSHFNVEPGGIQ